jgi:hypothetical protein
MIRILLNDRGLDWDQAVTYYEDADVWAVDHCASYHGCHVVDVTDSSYEFDLMAEYSFESEKDAMLFSLKWKQ